MLQRLKVTVARLFGGDRKEVALVGAWRLERYVDTPEGADAVHPFGTPPVGVFIFTSEGDVSINIMRNPPTEEVDTNPNPNPHPCIPAWYCSYFGRYTCDPVAGHWTTHVVGGNIPTFIGTDQPRPFKISGDTMIISGSYTSDDGKTVHYERVLRRVRR
jgi:hypothetical protein